MKLSTSELKIALSEGQEALGDDLTPRLSAMIEIIKMELLEKDETDLFDLIVYIILQADSIPIKYLVKLMKGITPEGLEYLDGWAIARTAGLLEDYMKKDNIISILKQKRSSNSKIS